MADGRAVLEGADDGSAFLHVPVPEGAATLWRRVRYAPDGTQHVAAFATEERGSSQQIVTDGSGTTAWLSQWGIVRIDPQGTTSELPGTDGVPCAAAIHDGVLGAVVDRPDEGGRAPWGAEIVRSDGTRAVVSDLGVAHRWELRDGGVLPFPGSRRVTSVRSRILSARFDARRRFLVLFLVQISSESSPVPEEELEGLAIGADGTVTAVELPFAAKESEVPNLRVSEGNFDVGADGTVWLFRNLRDPLRPRKGHTDVGALLPGWDAGIRRFDLGTSAFPRGGERAQGDVSSGRRVVLVSTDQVSGPAGDAMRHTLRLVWHRFDATPQPAIGARTRVLVPRLAVSESRTSEFEVRSLDTAVAPDGACVTAAVTRTRTRARERLVVRVVDPEGRILRRTSLRLSGENTVDTAACGDRGFVVLAVPNAGGETTALHFLR